MALNASLLSMAWHDALCVQSRGTDLCPWVSRAGSTDPKWNSPTELPQLPPSPWANCHGNASVVGAAAFRRTCLGGGDATTGQRLGRVTASGNLVGAAAIGVAQTWHIGGRYRSIACIYYHTYMFFQSLFVCMYSAHHISLIYYRLGMKLRPTHN